MAAADVRWFQAPPLDPGHLWPQATNMETARPRRRSSRRVSPPRSRPSCPECSRLARLEASPELVALGTAGPLAKEIRYTIRAMLRVEERMAEIAFDEHRPAFADARQTHQARTTLLLLRRAGGGHRVLLRRVLLRQLHRRTLRRGRSRFLLSDTPLGSQPARGSEGRREHRLGERQ